MLKIFYLIKTIASVAIDGDFEVQGSVDCVAIESYSIESEGSLTIDSSLTSETISSTYATTDSITVDTITSPTGTVTIQGNLNLSPSSGYSSFIETAWKLSHSDSFEGFHDHWSSDYMQECSQGFYLVGDCKVNEIYKKFVLAPHKYVRVTGILHMLDLWQGERLDVVADDVVIWSKKGYSHSNGINVCGLEHPDPGYGIKFDVMVPHMSSELLVTFKANLDNQHCQASFGVGKVSIFTRL
jgi:hypothetical protein